MKKKVKVFFGSLSTAALVVVMIGYFFKLSSSGYEPEVSDLPMPQHIANVITLELICDGLKLNRDDIKQDLKKSNLSIHDFLYIKGKHHKETRRYSDELMQKIDSGENDKEEFCLMGIISYGKEGKLKHNYLMGEDIYTTQ